MRSVEEMQAGLRTAMNEIQSIKDDLEQFKNAKSSGDLTADFKKISANAKRYPITPHPLSDTDEHTQKLYLTLLLSVAAYEPERLSDSLNFIHRIAYGCGYLEKGDLKEEFTSAQILTFDQLDEATGLFRENDLRLMLIEEMLITAGAFNKGRNAAFEYISRMCQLLNVNKDEISFLSNMAAVVLTKDASNYKCNYFNTYSMFDVYLMDIEFPMEIFNLELPLNVSVICPGHKWYHYISKANISYNYKSIKYNATYINALFPDKSIQKQMSIDIPSDKKLILLVDTIDRKTLHKRAFWYGNTPFLYEICNISVGILTSPLCTDNNSPAMRFFNENKILNILNFSQDPEAMSIYDQNSEHYNSLFNIEE